MSWRSRNKSCLYANLKLLLHLLHSPLAGCVVETSLIATGTVEDPDRPRMLIDIPLDLDVDVQVMKLKDDDETELYEDTRWEGGGRGGEGKLHVHIYQYKGCIGPCYTAIRTQGVGGWGREEGKLYVHIYHVQRLHWSLSHSYEDTMVTRLLKPEFNPIHPIGKEAEIMY